MLEKEETATKPLFEIRHLLVVAAQKEYDARIARGLHPYSMASYQFENFIHNELNKYISDTHEWKSGDWRKFQASKELYKYKVILDDYKQNIGPFSKGLWLVGAYIDLMIAWSTPGFSEAYRNHCQENN